MKTFTQWAEDNKLTLPVVNDTEGTTKTIEEKTKRTGLSGNYPPAYVAGQYPHKYFNPIKATADLDIANGAKVGK